MKLALAILAVAPLLVAGQVLPDLFSKLVMSPVRTIFSPRQSNQPGRYTIPVYRPAGQFAQPTYQYAPAYNYYNPGMTYNVPAYRPNYRPAQAPPQYTYTPMYDSNGQLISNAINSFFPIIPSYGRPNQPKPDPVHQEAAEHSSAGGHSHFGYNGHNGPETWSKDFPDCGGNFQSPINIEVQNLQQRAYSPLNRQNYWTQPEAMVLENNGHTLEVSGTWAKGKTPSITGGPLSSVYALKQLHIHWGRTDDVGSEHTVSGNTFPMELHVVHWNTDYGTYDEAVKHKNGLAVVGYFFEIAPTENPMLEQFVEYTKKVRGSKATEVEIEHPMPIGILDLDSNEYVTYQGSLTTPPCSEIVTWIVSTKPLTLSSRQMAELRNVVEEDGEKIHNNRPTMPLNGRPVYVNQS